MATTEPKLEKKIVDLLNQRPQSVSNLARELNVRRDFLSGYLESLKDRGKLQMFRVGKAYVYQLVRRRKNE